MLGKAGPVFGSALVEILKNVLASEVKKYLHIQP